MSTLHPYPWSVTTFSIFIIALFVTIGCTDHPTEPEVEVQELAAAISPEWIEANANSSTLAHELNAVRKATQKYKDPQAARDDGYVVVSVYIPEMGFHFINPTLIAADENAVVDITEPPIMVYYTTGNYRPDPFSAHDPANDRYLRLGAVEYAHVGTQGAAANYFSDEDAPRNLRGSESEGWEFVPPEGITALHAWVHRGNPEGVFHPTNPTIR